MLKNWFRIIRAVVLTIGLFFCFFAFIEVIRAYQTLRDLHPIFGYAFLTAILAAVVWLVWYLWVNLAAVPHTLRPPVIGNPAQATPRQLKKYLHYLRRFLERLTINTSVSDEKHLFIQTALGQIERALADQPTPETMRATIEVVESCAILPALADIDALAARQVRDSMRDIMIGVTLSPYKSADLFIVLYRNLMMTLRIIRLYNARPAVADQLRILLDMLNVIATVNYINMGKNLIESLGSRVPGIGRFIDDIAQGVGAGFVTTIAGHAAMDRCRAFKGWNAAEAKRHLLGHVGDFYNDVKDIFFKDVWQGIRWRAGTLAADTGDKVADAIDATGGSLTSFVRMPIRAASAAGQTVVTASTLSATAVYHTGAKGAALLTDAAKSIGVFLSKPFKKHNQ